MPPRAWLGLSLVGVVAAVWVAALLFFQSDCEFDCGDQGGRGMFLLVTLVSPVGALGAGLVVSSIERAIRAGHKPSRPWRHLVEWIRALVGLGALGSGGLAAIFLLGFLWDREDGAVLFFGLLWAGITYLAVIAMRRLGRVLRDWP